MLEGWKGLGIPRSTRATAEGIVAEIVFLRDHGKILCPVLHSLKRNPLAKVDAGGE
jgi:hypothetical protein